MVDYSPRESMKNLAEYTLVCALQDTNVDNLSFACIKCKQFTALILNTFTPILKLELFFFGSVKA